MYLVKNERIQLENGKYFVDLWPHHNDKNEFSHWHILLFSFGNQLPYMFKIGEGDFKTKDEILLYCEKSIEDYKKTIK